MRGKSTLNRILFVVLIATAAIPAVAQITHTETFDFVGTGTTWPNINLPFGWQQFKITAATDSDNVWERMNNTATNPACTPHTWGLGATGSMMRFTSKTCQVAGSQSALVSRAYDFRAYAAPVATVSFWMYRDNGGAGINDNIAVYVNNAPNLTGAVLLGGSANPLNRPCASAPAVSCASNAWFQYTYNIPYTVGLTTTVNTYVILVATGLQGNNMYVDDFQIITYPNQQNYTNSSLSYQNTNDVAKNTTNNMIVGAKVVMDGAGTPYAIDSLTFNTNGTTLPTVATDFNTARLYWTGNYNNFTLTNAILLSTIAGVPPAAPYATNHSFRPPTAATTIPGGAAIGANSIVVASAAGIIVGSTLSGSGLAAMTKVVSISGTTIYISTPTTAAIGAGSAVTATFYIDNGDNYFWVTYDVPLAATSGNYLDADFLSIKVALTTFTPSTLTLPGARQIDVAYCGGNPPFYSVGTSWLSGSYTNNDYVRSVIMPGYAAVYPPGINNIYNTVWGAQIPASSCTFPTCRFACHPPDYEAFNPAIAGNTATIMPDSTYNINVQVGTWGSGNYVAAWIDYNKNGSFADPGEKILQSASLLSLGWSNANFTVPSGAFIGTTTLRVREVYLGSNIDPCANATYGETEDYKVTIITPCAVAGWKVWLGFTDDWFTATNWCGGVPTINDNALIPGGGAAGYKRPVIRGATGAVCKKLRIEGTDTLYCNSYQGGTLTCADSLNIANATGRLSVVSSYDATAVISSANLYNALYTILKQSVARQKVQLVYSRTELLAKGLVAGDVIDQVIFNIANRQSFKGINTTSPYTNFNINYYYTNPSFCYSTTTYAPNVVAGGNVYSGTLNTGSITYNTAGQIIIPLTTPITWSGVNNSLVIEFCYDLTAVGIGTGADRFEQTQTPGCNSTMVCLNPAGGAPSGCTMPDAAPQLRYITSQRPNVTYHYYRPYKKFNISVGGATGGDWINNGSFVPNLSRVTMAASAAQAIRGTTATTFYDLTINNTSAPAAGVTMSNDVTVTDSLRLTNGALKLNTRLLTLSVPTTNALTRLAGYLVSENPPPTYGRLKWNHASNYALYEIPFGNSAGIYIPFRYTPSAGTNDMTYATYATIPANTPIPTGVTHINGFYTGTNNSANMVDRYWQIDNAGTGGTGDMEFAYANTEIPANGNTNIRAQHWTNALTRWDDPNMFIGQTNPMTGPSTYSAKYNASNRFGSWALTREAQPLPIDLLSFNARPEKDKVKIYWSTASEHNNDYFTVERTLNASEYSFVADVKSKGNSNALQEYYTYDYKPVVGTQYYRLKQTDFDGKYTYSNLVPVTFGKADEFEIVSVANNNNGSQTVYFKYDSDSKVSYKLVDILGKLVTTQTDVDAFNGVNQIELKHNFASGVYTLIISDSKRMISRKIVY